jgi:type III pantothenate kinase
MNKSQVLLLGSSKRKLAIFENNEISHITKGSCSAVDLQNLNLDQSIKTLIISVRQDLEPNFPKQNIQFFSNELAGRIFNLNNLYIGFGQDRLASLIAAINFFPSHSIGVLDLGTCNTFSFLEKTAENGYKLTESFICPGISSSFQVLKQATTSLPLVSELDFINYCLAENNPVNSPKSAICEGVLQQTFALFNKIKTDYSNAKLLLTGGWSELFENIDFDLVKPDLPLIGGNIYLNAL